MAPERMPPKENEGWLDKIAAPIVNIINTWLDKLFARKKDPSELDKKYRACRISLKLNNMFTTTTTTFTS